MLTAISTFFILNNMIIEKVNRSNIHLAAHIHRESWKESHKAFVSAQAVAKRTVERQTAYLFQQIDSGRDVYMLTDDIPVGIVSVCENLIENLYILPERQRCGYGSRLLDFAVEKCIGNPVLTVLSNNTAIEMYRKYGFKETGKTIPLNPTLWEIEMILERKNENNGS